MRRYAFIVAALFSMAPLCARAADLVVWWEQGYNPEEDAAVREIVATFEQDTGKQVELVPPSHNDMVAKSLAAVQAGQPPDFLFGFDRLVFGQSAYEDRLVDLSDVIGPFENLFDPDALSYATLPFSTLRAMFAMCSLWGQQTGGGAWPKRST